MTEHDGAGTAMPPRPLRTAVSGNSHEQGTGAAGGRPPLALRGGRPSQERLNRFGLLCSRWRGHWHGGHACPSP